MALTRSSFPTHTLLLGALAGTSLALADTWDNSAGNAQWSTATNWADNTEPTSTDPVIFPSTIPLNQATILMTTTEFCSTLTFNNDYTLQGGQMFIIDGGVSVVGGRTATINTVINGSAGLSKTGFGTLRLLPTSSNSFSGPISITGINSTLYVRSNAALGNSVNNIDINAGKLQLDGISNPTFLITGRTITAGASGGTIELLNNAFLDLNTALGANANALGFVGTPSCTVELNTASARTGPTTVNGVFLRLNSAQGLGAPGLASLSNGAVLEINSSGVFAGTLALAAGTSVRGGTGTHTFDGVANISGNLSLNGGLASSDVLLLGPSGGDVLRGGAGATTTVSVGGVGLRSANSYAGSWTIAGGVLDIRDPNALGTGTTPIVVNGSGQLRLTTPSLARDITLNNPGGGIEVQVDCTVRGNITIAPNAAFVPIVQVISGREFTLAGAASSMTYTGTAYFGGAIGVASMRVFSGADVTGTSTRVFGNANGPARLTISGAGSTWQNTTDIWVGTFDGTGSLLVDGGGVLSCPQVYIGQQGNTTATVSGEGSLLSCSNLLAVGFGSTSSLSVLDGADVTAGQAHVGELASGVGSLTIGGTGSSFVSTDLLEVGKTGTGTLTLSNGGSVSCPGLALGNGATSSGSCTVSGTLSRLDCGANGVTLSQSGAASTLNLVGGIVDINGDITDAGSGSSTFILDAATLDMHGHAIGAGPSLIDSLQLRSGTLKNVSQINNGAGLNKTGPGTLLLNTSNTYSGPTVVTQGTLLVENTSGSATSTGPITIFGGATLAGPGRVAGPVNNQGVISPAGFVGNPIGTLSTLGGFSQSSTGTLSVEIGSATSFDSLAVTGSASLAGMLNASLLNGYQPSAGDSFTILTASSLGGTFASTNLPSLPAGLEWNIEYSGTSVRLVVRSACIADVDDGMGSGLPDGGVTIDDLLYYLFIFEAGDIRSDVDDGSGTGTPDGGVTIDDLLYYLARFEAGC